MIIDDVADRRRELRDRARTAIAALDDLETEFRGFVGPMGLADAPDSWAFAQQTAAARAALIVLADTVDRLDRESSRRRHPSAARTDRQDDAR